MLASYAFSRLRVGHVAADGRDAVDAAVDHLPDPVGHLGADLHHGIDADHTRDLGVMRRQPQRKGATHRQAGHDHLVHSGREVGVRRLDAPDQSAQPVSIMSSTDVPCPGRSGNSTAYPAPCKAFASPRRDCGLPVKPWITSAP